MAVQRARGARVPEGGAVRSWPRASRSPTAQSPSPPTRPLADRVRQPGRRHPAQRPHRRGRGSAHAGGPGLFDGALVTRGPPAHVPPRGRALPPGSYGFICDVHPNMTGHDLRRGGRRAGRGGRPPGGPQPPSEPSHPRAGQLRPARPDRDRGEHRLRSDRRHACRPRGRAVTFVFENEDALPHNVAVTAGRPAATRPVRRASSSRARTRSTYSFEAPPTRATTSSTARPIPQMEGTLTVE